MRHATKGSSFLATLGWMTQSLWDCRAGNFSDPGIFENGGVELHRLLGLVIEPQKWCDLLHRGSIPMERVCPFTLSPGTRRVDRMFRSSPVSCPRARRQTSCAPRPWD